MRAWELLRECVCGVLCLIYQRLFNAMDAFLFIFGVSISKFEKIYAFKCAIAAL